MKIINRGIAAKINTMVWFKNAPGALDMKIGKDITTRSYKKWVNITGISPKLMYMSPYIMKGKSISTILK